MTRPPLAAGLFILTLLTAALTQSCRKSDTPSPAAKQTDSAPTPAKRIGASLLTVRHQFYQDLRAGLQAEADKYGYELFISTAEFDPVRQCNQIDEFIVRGVDAMIVCPCDSHSIGACIAQANASGIPVFTADIASTSPLGKVVAHIASDNRLGGRKAAILMIEALGGTGKVAILSHPEVTSVMDRVAGFKDELAKHPAINIVAELSTNGRRDKAVQVMEDLMQSHADLNGVFGINDDSALGALAAIQAAGKARQIRIVGYDATPEARQKINSGLMIGDVVQNPRLIGELTVRAIHDVLNGTTPPAIIPVAVGTYTGDSG